MAILYSYWVCEVKGQHKYSITFQSQSIMLRQLLFVQFNASISVNQMYVNMSKVFID